MDFIQVVQTLLKLSIKSDLYKFNTACFQEPLNHEDKSIVECKAKIEELEDELMRLKEENESLRRELTDADGSKDMSNIITNYESVMEKLIQEHEAVKTERDLAKNHLANLEKAFYDLVQKYERAKTVIQGFEKNEQSYQKHLSHYEESIGKAEKKYTEFREYAIEKLNEANVQLEMNSKDYLQEVSKLRAKVIQSQMRVNDLERQMSRTTLRDGDNSKSSIFDPLTNDIT